MSHHATNKFQVVDYEAKKYYHKMWKFLLAIERRQG